MINLKDALRDPASVFDSPKDVLLSNLTTDQKAEILRRWKCDIQEVQVASEENMPGNGKDLRLLEEILEALHILGANIDTEHTPPTKQGG